LLLRLTTKARKTQEPIENQESIIKCLNVVIYDKITSNYADDIATKNDHTKYPRKAGEMKKMLRTQSLPYGVGKGNESMGRAGSLLDPRQSTGL